MASIKQAAESAFAFAEATLGPERSTDARLEEVESITTPGGDAWLITLSMKGPVGSSLAEAVYGRSERSYKVFTVLKSNGEVTSMKIRELANA